MYAAALRVEARVPDVQSLKEKRHRIQAVFTVLNKKFPVSVSEVDYQDLWQRTAIGVAVVAPQAGQLDRILHSVERTLRHQDGIEVLEIEVAHMERDR
jgi:hypothetical protein